MVLKANGKTFIVKSCDGAIEVVEHNFKILTNEIELQIFKFNENLPKYSSPLIKTLT